MSTIIKKTSFLSGSFLLLAVLCSCAKSVSDQNSVYYPSTPALQPNDVAMQSGFYGYGHETYAVNNGKSWGPICPLDGTDLAYLQTSNDIAISMPSVANANSANMGNAPCVPPAHMPPMPMPVQNNNAGHMIQHQPAPAPMHQQAMVPAPQYQQPMLPVGTGYNSGSMGTSQPAGESLPVRGVIGGANQDGYLFLDCSGQYISNKSNCAKNGRDAKKMNHSAPQYGNANPNLNPNNAPNSMNTVANDGIYGGAGAVVSRNDNSGVVEEWVASEGVSLRLLLEEWGDRAGWKVVWNSNREYIVEAGAVFKGEFMDVSSALIRAFARANPAPQGTFYKGNKVLVINTQEAENAE